jgi:signal transduction histidine kinase/DNA-binding NarL/FixJ family response regulator
MMRTKKLERYITVSYISGLLIVGMLLSVSTLLLYKTIGDKETASHIYNLISAQQNRIQRIALLTVALTDNPSTINADPLKERLLLTADELEADHQSLVNELVGFQFTLPQQSTETLAKEQITAFWELDKEMRSYIDSAKYLGNLDRSAFSKNDLAVNILLDKANSNLTGMLEDLQSRYRDQHENQISDYKRYQFISLGSIILVLILEGVFLFRPIVNFVKKEHEGILKAKEEADRANKVKTEFLANISHEIRTPLTAIMGFSDMLLDSRTIREEERKWGVAIGDNANHLKCLIDDLLDLARIEKNDDIQIHKSYFDLDAMIRQIASNAAVKAASRGLRFETTYRTPVPRFITADADRLKQILNNLLTNAVKFTERGGIQFLIFYDQQLRVLTFKVIDTGIGIPPGKQDKLFRRFYQVNKSYNRPSGGSGVGLALSKIVAVKLGGNLVLESSDPGAGSVFNLTIAPSQVGDDMVDSYESKPSQKSTQLTRDKIAGALRGAKILLVEDGEENRRIYTYFLEMAHAKVDVAVNGLTGVEKALNNGYDLVLMDIQMPTMDGYAALAKLQEANYQIPVIALTAHALSVEKQRCLEAGFQDYLSKPVAMDHLLQVVSSYVKKKSPTTVEMTEETSKFEESLDDSSSPILSSYHSQEIFKPMIKEFCQNLPSRIDEIKSALELESFGELKKVVHKMKGSAASFGYPQLSHEALKFENVMQAQPVSSDELQTCVANLQRISERIISGSKTL